MGEYLVLELAKLLIYALVGSLATYIVMTVRRDVAQAAREDERVEAEFAPTLARVRPLIAAGRNLRPRWLPAAGRGGWARVRQAVAGALAGVRSVVAARLSRPRPAAAPVAALALPAPPVYPGRDVNAFTWPTNPTPPPAEPVGRVPVALDFDPMAEDFTAWVRGTNARLHHEATRWAADPDATGLIPAVPAGVRS